MFFSTPNKKEGGRWALCFALVLFMHVGFAAGVSIWSNIDKHGGGAPVEAIMIDMVAVAPKQPEKLLPVGAKQEKHKPVVEPKPMLSPDPLAMPEPVPEQKPEDDRFQEVKEDRAPKSVELPEDVIQKSPSPEALAATSAAQATWHSRLIAHMERHKRYPRSARIRHQEGVSKIRIVLDRDGNVLSCKLSGSAGYELLDKATLDMVARAAPFPKMPDDIFGESKELIVPVEYSIR
ncbi:MAG: energy transducer TonB [Alcanivoracaceae bacterium]|nr:energy transducer TonB [Alcanivoracaceae bacterium]